MILDALPDSEYERLERDFHRLRMDVGDVFVEAGEPLSSIYFPLSGVLSMLAVTPEGGSLEVAPIGSEGVAGLSVLTGSGPSPWRFLVQSDGEALSLPLDAFRRSIGSNARFLEALVGYSAQLLELASQGAVCNRFHELHQRLAFWLLCMHDRVEGDEITITHEVAADMLGVHRPSVTVALHMLEESGAVEARRGRIAITDRAALERLACRCYDSVGRLARPD